MIKKEVNAALDALSATGKYAGEKFRYAHAKNVVALKNEQRLIIAATRPSDDFVKYQQAQYALVTKYGKKDENGQFVIENGRVVLQNEDEFKTAADELDIQFTETRELFTERQKEVEKYLELEIENALHIISEKQLPADISAEDYARISFMIEGF